MILCDIILYYIIILYINFTYNYNFHCWQTLILSYIQKALQLKPKSTKKLKKRNQLKAKQASYVFITLKVPTVSNYLLYL